MILKFDKEKLDRILFDYCKLTGLSIALVDSDFEYIASSHAKGCGFCRILQERDNGYRCKCSDHEIIKKCKESGKAQTHICHAGLCDMAIPLISDGELIAYIILGRIKMKESFDEIEKLVSWFTKDIAKLKDEYMNLSYYDEDGVKSVANIAVAVAAYILGDGVIKPQYNVVADRAARFISENIQKEITVSLLCRKLGVSKNLLYEAFRTAFGCTVKEYITEKRISKALRLLLETNIPVGEIADSVGIYNHTYFSRVFTQRTGVSPLKYRNSVPLCGRPR